MPLDTGRSKNKYFLPGMSLRILVKVAQGALVLVSVASAVTPIAEVAWGKKQPPLPSPVERHVYDWDSPAPTQKSQVSCNIHLKENREKKGKTQLTEKASSQISGKGREKGFSCAGLPTGVCTDNCPSEHGSVYTHPPCCA